MTDIKLEFRKMNSEDLSNIVLKYISYFNNVEGASWTEETALRKFNQLFYREDNISLILEIDEDIAGYVIGQLIQFDDGLVFELSEILIFENHQNKGYGSLLLNKIQKLAKESGAFMIQLISALDDHHTHFYNKKHGFKNAANNVQKSKPL